MTEPTAMPFQDGERREGDAHDDGAAAEQAPASDLLPPAETETDLLAARVEGPEDQEGMTALWRATMGLPSWWFIAVGDPGLESPAAAEIDDKLMLLTFTNSERARHFAVQNGMIRVDEDMRAISLTPSEVVASADVYRSAEIEGLMFDPHLTGYFISTEQLPVVWQAIAEAGDDAQQSPQG